MHISSGQTQIHELKLENWLAIQQQLVQDRKYLVKVLNQVWGDIHFIRILTLLIVLDNSEWLKNFRQEECYVSCTVILYMGIIQGY